MSREALQLDEDLEFQRRFWAVQRGGWTVMALALAAAMAGLFGQGPVSRARAFNSEKTWSARYDRFPRVDSATEVKFAFPAGAQTDPVRLKLGKDYLDRMRLVRAVPEPLSMETGPEGVTLVFDIEDPLKESSVTLVLEPKRPGRASMGPIRQFIYP